MNIERLRRPRLPAAFGALLVLGLTVAAGTAWACIPQPLLTVQPQAFGPPGAKVKVTGLNFGNFPVELRWNGFDGERLQTVNGPEFTADVTIPAAPDGIYVVLGVPRAVDGSVAGTVPAAVFQVTASGVRGPEQASAGTGPKAREPSPSISKASAAVGGAGLLALGLAVGLAVSHRRKLAAVPST